MSSDWVNTTGCEAPTANIVSTTSTACAAEVVAVAMLYDSRRPGRIDARRLMWRSGRGCTRRRGRPGAHWRGRAEPDARATVPEPEEGCDTRPSIHEPRASATGSALAMVNRVAPTSLADLQGDVPAMSARLVDVEQDDEPPDRLRRRPRGMGRCWSPGPADGRHPAAARRQRRGDRGALHRQPPGPRRRCLRRTPGRDPRRPGQRPAVAIRRPRRRSSSRCRAHPRRRRVPSAGRTAHHPLDDRPRRRPPPDPRPRPRQPRRLGPPRQLHYFANARTIPQLFTTLPS